jgi:death on curing protein
VAARFLTMSEVLLILQDQIRRHGGTYGVRNPELLSSALTLPPATVDGKYLHGDLYEQAAAYALHLSQNRPFVDGNKRTALATALVFLSLSGVELHDPNGDLYELMTGIARSDVGMQEAAARLRQLKGTRRRQKQPCR